MAMGKLTDIVIAARIVPTSVRWPSTSSIQWDALRAGTDGLRDLIRALDANCLAVEQDTDLTAAAIQRRRVELGKAALEELENWKPLRTAEAAVKRTLDAIEEKMQSMPGPPSGTTQAMLWQEIRAHIKHLDRPVDFVLKNMDDMQTLGAVLGAPAFLSGLSESEWNVVREKARTALHPERAATQTALSKALDELRAGVEAAKRLILERCELRVDHEITGAEVVRAIREPAQKIAV